MPSTAPHHDERPAALVRPFARAGFYTVLDNALIDVLMPRVSPSAWKIVTALVRQTTGWHRETVAVTQSALARLAGLSENTTISATRELLVPDPSICVAEHGAVIVATRSSRREPLTYALNAAFTLVTTRPSTRAADGFADASERLSTSIFEVLSTATSAVPYKHTPTGVNKDPSGSALTRLADLVDIIPATLDTLPPQKQVAMLRDIVVWIWGEAWAGRETYTEVGVLRKQLGPGPAALALLRAAFEGATGNPVHFASAIAAARRRDAADTAPARRAKRVTADGPVPLALYDAAAVGAFVSAGVERIRFVPAGRDTFGNLQLRYVPAKPTTAP